MIKQVIRIDNMNFFTKVDDIESVNKEIVSWLKRKILRGQADICMHGITI